MELKVKVMNEQEKLEFLNEELGTNYTSLDELDEYDWVDFSADEELSEEFIRVFKDKVNWFWISTCQDLSEDFIREFQNYVHWDCLDDNQELSEDFKKEFADRFNG